MAKLVLASSSKRRQDLLKNAGYTFDIIVSDIDEDRLLNQGYSPEETVIALAEHKAMAVLNKVEDGTVVIGADTIVVLDNEILGKPVDKKHAFRMLKRLSGRWHKVYTGVAIMEKDGKIRSFSECSSVHMSSISDEEILNYIATNEPMDKAGSYGIQGIGGLFIEAIDGDFFAIEGLPVNKVYFSLKGFGILPEFRQVGRL